MGTFKRAAGVVAGFGLVVTAGVGGFTGGAAGVAADVRPAVQAACQLHYATGSSPYQVAVALRAVGEYDAVRGIVRCYGPDGHVATVDLR